MSKYTTEVRFICENAYNNENSGFTSIDTILNTVAPKIFNFDFPIFDEQYRIPLETKILRTYYTREICEETVGLWKLRLQNKLCNITKNIVVVSQFFPNNCGMTEQIPPKNKLKNIIPQYPQST